MKIRPLQTDDIVPLAASLNGWFAGHLSHLDYQEPLIRWLIEVVGVEGDASVVAVDDQDRLVGCWLAGLRRAHFGGQAVRVSHLWALAVSPLARRQGLARQLEAASAAIGSPDVLTCYTEEVYASARVYPKLGWRLLERFQPLGAMIGEVEPVSGVVEVSPAHWDASRPAREARAGAVVEAPLPACAEGGGVRIRRFLGGRAGVAVAVWPVRLRVDGRVTPVWSAQILDAYGPAPHLLAVTAHALWDAKQAGADAALVLPTVRDTAAGFTTEGGSWTLRFARGVTELGEAVVAEARCWDEVCPVP